MLAPVRTGPLWVGLLGLVVSGAPAHAGRRHLAWAEGTETVPERGYEIESWLADELGAGDADRDETRLGWAATVGVTERLELRLPAQVVWARADGDPAARTSIDRYGAELRYRLVTSDPVEAPALVPLVRVAVLHQANERGAVRVEGDLVVSYARGPVIALADLGVTGALRRGADGYALEPGGGVTVGVGHDLRVGAEVHAHVGLRGEDVDWVALGPSVAWTHGRGWLVLHAGIGVVGVIAAPRVAWGIAF